MSKFTHVIIFSICLYSFLQAQPTLLKDINLGASPAFAEGAVSSLVKIPMVKFQNKIYFVADDGVAGSELWESDGTPEGTQLLLDINPGSVGSNFINYSNKHNYSHRYCPTRSHYSTTTSSKNNHAPSPSPG